MAFEDNLVAQEVRLTLNDKIRAIRAANTGSKFTLKDAFAGSVHNDALYDWFLAFTRASERKENFQNVCNVSVDKPNHFCQILFGYICYRGRSDVFLCVCCWTCSTTCGNCFDDLWLLTGLPSPWPRKIISKNSITWSVGQFVHCGIS